MNKEEAALALALLKVAFPAGYRNLTAADAKATVNLWATMFEDDPYIEVEAAIKSIIATRKNDFPPSIAEVKEMLVTTRQPDRMTAQEAWSIVSKAAAGNLKWEELPENIQKSIGSPAVLNSWRMMQEDTFNSVVYSNFIKAYKIIEDREAMTARLPSSVRNLLGGTALIAEGEK